MIKDSFIRKLTPEHAFLLLQERQELARRYRRALPLIDWKMVTHPNWKGTCPKTGMPLTLLDIKEECQGYLEEMEEEIKQLESKSGPKEKQMELGL